METEGFNALARLVRAGWTVTVTTDTADEGWRVTLGRGADCATFTYVGRALSRCLMRADAGERPDITTPPV